MWWKHRKLDSEANESTSKSNKQQTEDHSTIDSTKCWKHQKENQRKANDREFANFAEDAEFANVASHGKFAKINAEVHICAKSSSSHKRKCKCECKCRWMKSDYQEILVKITKKSYHERRFIVNLKNENWTLKMMKMRDSMNNALKKTKIDLIVIMIVKMQKKNNNVLMILKIYIADVLLAQRAIWKHVFDVKSIKKDEK